MTWLWIALSALLLLVAVPLSIGACLPREHSATVARVYRRPAREIFDAITGFETMADWRDGVRKVEVLEPRDGKRMIREHSRFGPMTYRVEVEEPPRRLVLGIADQDQGFGGIWTYELREQGLGCELRITEDGYIDNLLFRCLARFVFGYDKTMRAYHESLAKKLGE